MTEEEKMKKSAAQQDVAVGQGVAVGQAAVTEQATTDAKKENPPVWKTNAAALRERANTLRTYSDSPVEIDTSGQKDYWHDFLNSRVSQEKDADDKNKAVREKRERTARRIAALTDGLVAISNVIGASQGATPITQTPLSSAHKAAVDAAVKRRKELNDRYDVARKNALTLAQKQEAANEERMAEERKLRREAAKQADDLDAKAAAMENAGAAADRKFGLDEIKQQAAQRHQHEMEQQGERRIALSRERNSISRSKKGGGGDSTDWDEYEAWREAYPDEVEHIRSDNAQLDIMGNPRKGRDSNIVKQTNAYMRRKYGTPKKAAEAKRKKASPTGSRGKKKSPTA